MIRLSLLWLFILFFSLFAWRDWYKSLCALIALMAVVEHPDFPKTLMGIQGLNPWNILLLSVSLAWLASKKRENLIWDMPRRINWYLFFYFLIIVIAFVRLSVNLNDLRDFDVIRGLEPDSFGGIVSEYIVNCFKWVIPGLLLYHGCNSESRLKLAVLAVSFIYFFLAIQVIRWMPLAGIAGGDDLKAQSLKILSREVGFHRVNMSMILAGASWALFSARELWSSKLVRVSFLCCVLAIMFAQALTGGRMGYVTWMAIAFSFGLVKWRKILFLAPIAAAIILTFVPAVQERLFEGFTPDSISSNSRIESHQYRDEDEADLYSVTAGRTFAWGFVVDKIFDAPLFGYGRRAMVTTGVAPYLWLEYGESFPHPHNAYLQWILDNGLVGTIPVFLFYLLVFRSSYELFRLNGSRICVATGGFCLALILALFVAAIGSQTFYPREGAVGMWCAIGLMLRLHVQWKAWQERGISADSIDGNQEFWMRSFRDRGQPI